MVKGQEHVEKLMKVFWLRLTTLSPLLVFFLLLFSFMFFSGRIDLAKKLYVGFSSRTTLQTSTGKSESTPEFPLNCAVWNQTKTCPEGYPKTSNFNPLSESTCPEYFRWIHEDLKPWKQTGISKDTVEKAQKTAHFRLIILNGKVYVEKFRESIQTRALFTLWGIVQLVRLYPGILPDLELMFDCDDRPVVDAKLYRHVKLDPPPPVFRYCSDWKSLDIVFPDWSFWGWAETNIRPWRSMLKDIEAGNKKTKWEDRAPYAYWKGNPRVCPWRVDLLKCNATNRIDWSARIYVQDWIAESEKGYQQSNLGDQCTHRYKIYIEGWAWSVSEKYILACNSPTLLMTLHWYDFFIRGMIPQHNYWPIRDNNKCKSLKFAVEWGNNHTEKAKAIGEAGSRFIHKEVKMEYVYDYMFHLLNEYAKLFNYKPTIPPNAVELCAESLACSTGGIWRNFMDESLEMSPSSSGPCIILPPYKPQELEAFINRNVKAIKEVDALVADYWNKQNTRQ